MESQTIELVDSNGESHHAEMRRWDEAPGNEDEVLIELAVGDTVIQGTSDRGYFHAFCGIRRQLEALGLMPRCFAACENVYPSPMIESMGCGEKAYFLTLGKQAKTCDLVEVFDASDEICPVTVEQQRAFYERWIESL